VVYAYMLKSKIAKPSWINHIINIFGLVSTTSIIFCKITLSGSLTLGF
jgi:hypothetical protein